MDTVKIHVVVIMSFHIRLIVQTGYSLGWEASVGRLHVDLRGSRSSGPMCPSISLFKIIQLVLYRGRETERDRETKTEGEKMPRSDG